MRVEAVREAPGVVAAETPALRRRLDVARVHHGEGRAWRQLVVREAVGDQLVSQFLVGHLVDGPAHIEEPNSVRFCISDESLLDFTQFELDKLVALRHDWQHVGQPLERLASFHVLLLTVVTVEKVKYRVDPVVPYFLELALQPLVLTDVKSLDLELLLTPFDHTPFQLIGDAFAPVLGVHLMAITRGVDHRDDEPL